MTRKKLNLSNILPSRGRTFIVLALIFVISAKPIVRFVTNLYDVDTELYQISEEVNQEEEPIEDNLDDDNLECCFLSSDFVEIYSDGILFYSIVHENAPNFDPSIPLPPPKVKLLDVAIL